MFYRMTLQEADERLSAPEFLALCFRLLAYGGVVSAKAAAAAERQRKRSPVTGPGEVDKLPSTRSALAASPIGDLVEFG